MDLSRSINWTLIDSLSKILFLPEMIIEFLLIKSTIGHCYLITCLNFMVNYKFGLFDSVSYHPLAAISYANPA